MLLLQRGLLLLLRAKLYPLNCLTTKWLNWTETVFPKASFFFFFNEIDHNCKELTHWKRLWCWEGLGARGEGDDRMRWLDGITDSMDVWVNSGSWWWTGRPGVLRFMGSQSRTRLSDWSESESESQFVFIHLFVYCHVYCKNFHEKRNHVFCLPYMSST